MEIKLIIIW